MVFFHKSTFPVQFKNAHSCPALSTLWSNQNQRGLHPSKLRPFKTLGSTKPFKRIRTKRPSGSNSKTWILTWYTNGILTGTINMDQNRSSCSPKQPETAWSNATEHVRQGSISAVSTTGHLTSITDPPIFPVANGPETRPKYDPTWHTSLQQLWIWSDQEKH